MSDTVASATETATAREATTDGPRFGLAATFAVVSRDRPADRGRLLRIAAGVPVYSIRAASARRQRTAP